MKSPFAQPEKSRVANVTIAKSRVLAAQVLRILSRKGFGTAKLMSTLRAQVVGAFSLSSPKFSFSRALFLSRNKSERDRAADGRSQSGRLSIGLQGKNSRG
jgi:hypothetical protein